MLKYVKCEFRVFQLERFVECPCPVTQNYSTGYILMELIWFKYIIILLAIMFYYRFCSYGDEYNSETGILEVL